ncbi:hypothetical protein P7C70_g5270, partial [Phenoliferia sp. Uapishka_3]
MSSNFLELIRLKRLSPTTFETLALTERMGNQLPIAYGGCALAVAVQAAYHSLPVMAPGAPKMVFYSMVGHYLGPTATDRHIKILVEDVRSTRTFATRRVVLSQTQNDGSERSTLAVTFDFIASSPTSVLRFHIPAPSIVHHSETPIYFDALDERVAAKTMEPWVASTYKRVFGLYSKFFDLKMPDNEPLSQNAWGVDKEIVTSQDHLPLTEKRTAHWFRSKVNISKGSPAGSDGALPISPESASASLLAFGMDGALSFVPLSFSHLFLEDAGACSTLDFALRFHTEE